MAGQKTLAEMDKTVANELAFWIDSVINKQTSISHHDSNRRESNVSNEAAHGREERGGRLAYCKPSMMMLFRGQSIASGLAAGSGESLDNEGFTPKAALSAILGSLSALTAVSDIAASLVSDNTGDVNTALGADGLA